MEPLTQEVSIIDGETYRYTIELQTSGKFGLDFYIAAELVLSNIIDTAGLHIITGDYVASSTKSTFLEITPGIGTDTGIIFSVSLRQIIHVGTDDSIPVKEFLTGELDDNQAIFFRADTQILQMMPNFEKFANPFGVVTKLQRGSSMKCFVSLDNDTFYALDGTAKKGISILKINSKDINSVPTPPVARKITISWRDSSKQLCRLTQGAVLFIPTTMDYSE